MITRNKALRVHTGHNGKPNKFSRQGNEFYPDEKGTWYKMQMLPIVPQRFEFVRKSNLLPHTQAEASLAGEEQV